jgi:hypothetical protein
MTITRNHRHHQHFNDFNGGALAHYKQQTIVIAICDFLFNFGTFEIHCDVVVVHHNCPL